MGGLDVIFLLTVIFIVVLIVVAPPDAILAWLL